MGAIIRQELKMNRKSLFYWCAGMGLLLAVAAAEYGTVVNAEQSIMPMLMAMPKIIRVMFAMNALPIDTPIGYFACMLLWFSFIIFFYGAFLGASIMAKEERDRTADYIFTKPYSRNIVMTGKVLAAIVDMLVLDLLTWMVSALAFGNPNGSDSIQKEITQLMIGMFLVQIVFFTISFFVSSITKMQKTASGYAMGVVMIAYFLGVGIEYQDAKKLDFLSLFRYFNVSEIIEKGMRWQYILLCFLWILIFTFWAYRVYNKRDLQ